MVCLQGHHQAQCKSVFDDTGQFNIETFRASAVAVDSSDTWTPGASAEGIFTMIYTFVKTSGRCDDEFRFNINLTSDFVDVVADTDHNPLTHLKTWPSTTTSRCLTRARITFSSPKANQPCAAFAPSPVSLAGNFGMLTTQ